MQSVLKQNFFNAELEKLNQSGCRVYKRRWFLILIFMIHVLNGAVQWAQYTSISNLIAKYYNVSLTSVEWTANIFTFAIIILLIPSSIVITRLGVRKTLILSAVGMTLGNCVKLVAVLPNRFYLVMIGETISATSTVFSFGLLSRFTALWFPVSEISFAGVLCLLGNQLGDTCAFLLPSIIVKDGSLKNIENGLRLLQAIFIGSCTVILFMIVFFFKERPNLPPCLSQVKKNEKSYEISALLIYLAKSKAYILFALTYGLNSAFYSSMIVFSNELLSLNFPEHVNETGNIGSLMLISGMVGSIIIGKIQDKTRQYKLCTVFLTISSTVCMILYILALKFDCILYLYIICTLRGFFLLSLTSNGIQLGLEITYPIPEHMSTTVQFFSTQIFILLMNVVYSFLIKVYGDLFANMVIVVLYVLTSIFAILIPSEMKRSLAEKS